ncbi:cholinesterase 2-like [Penaeus japonicus]|uniref:cholinesterase 2-like n=1 Tax=Penaeus japonicus TaxID=27405 RepID=UPI001C70E63A|nr:cholinesterase 2-like [Penaeus japonicus]XP_042894420.1 cholinesterase 2-like [Penaeus japonicus]XP_042894421.1 cholinesterase 2-like [Penaeus japonicus]XP_042894422.1 cholinesterase 2-like [Penaeus japonicus]XP_042894423.1 cholinesterase 2-like [Penaeus japonicus]
MNMLYAAVTLAALAAVGSGAPVVTLMEGRVSGMNELSTKGKEFFSYYGIPYAKPPLEKLKLKDPVRADKWAGTRDGSKMPPPCLQPPFESVLFGRPVSADDMIGDEDCLFLNVFTPKKKKPDERLPVMVFIHGGAFFVGAAEDYLPHVLMNHRIVLVVLQYRLGTLGFLSTEDMAMPGNFGLKDQVMGLRWVQENIHNFGGDAARVTIFGESAGGASVHYHILSPKSKGLFSRAILQSGSALDPWANGDKFRPAAFLTSRVSRCPKCILTRDVTFCLQLTAGREVASAVQNFTEWFIFPLPTVPRVDGDFLPDEPASLMRQGKYNRVDVMAGITRDEGAFVADPLFAREDMARGLRNNFSAFGPLSLNCMNEEDPVALSTKIYEHYLGDLAFDEEHSDQLAQLYGDWFFNVPHDLTSQVFARDPDTKIYRYELKHRAQLSFSDFFETSFGKNWISHGDDLYYLFRGGPLFAPDSLPDRAGDLLDADDLKLRDIITTMWTNFAATGNPTPDDSLGFKWEPATESSFRHLALKPSPEMEDDHRREVRHFLTSLPTKVNKLLHPERVLTGEAPATRTSQDEL